MNDETAPPAGTFAGPYNWFAFPRSAPNTNQGGAANYYTQEEKAISPDGASIFFTETGTGQVYVRRNPTQPQSLLNGSGECEDPAKACTIRISKSEKTNRQGRRGVLQNSTDICKSVHRINLKLSGQNGKVSSSSPPTKASCPKKAAKNKRGGHRR